MKTSALLPLARAALLSVLAASGPRDLPAQVPAAPSPTSLVYRAVGSTDGPFTVEVVDVRRASGNTLAVRLNLRNDGNAPLHVRFDFAPDNSPADARKISALYLIDPNGRQRLNVLRDAAGVAQCSAVDPDLAPGERRELLARFPAPPSTSNAVEVHFPKTAEPIVGVPIGLPAGGEPIAANAPVTVGSAVAASPGPVSAAAAPTPAIEQPGTNFKPDVYTNQLPGTIPASDAAKKTAGHVQASNSDVPFTVEVISLRRAAGGQSLDLRVALTNNSSGVFDVGDYFTAGRTDTANARRISGVYVVDPATQARAAVERDGTGKAVCSEVQPALNPGERRELSARLVPALPATTRTVYLYFPQSSPIQDVPVGN